MELHLPTRCSDTLRLTSLRKTTIRTKPSMQHYLVKGLCKGAFAGIPHLNLDAGAKVLEGIHWHLAHQMERDFPSGQYWMIDLPANMWPDTQFLNNSKRLNFVESSSLNQFPLSTIALTTFTSKHNCSSHQSSWPPVISELTRAFKPGGYIDLVDLDPHPSTSPTLLVANFLNEQLGTMRAGGFFLVERHRSKNCSMQQDSTQMSKW
ncbi:hypothetical protein BJ742DRAFT_101691 [Cladochytrium replicatum]|nr:hypothetical protein BJ742DRAFT_101691 [Cladochytrium replicatum]